VYHIFNMSDSYYVFPKLFGGLGNRLFQLYTAKYYSEINNLPLKIVKDATSAAHGSLEDFFALFPEIEHVEADDFVIVIEKSNHRFMLFDKPPKENIMLQGYFQTYTYCANTNLFPNWRNALKEKYDAILEGAGLNTIDGMKNTWAIHFRNGDYNFIPGHQMPRGKYYRNCIYEIPVGARLIAYSDEPELSQEFLENMVKDKEITVVWSKLTKDIEVLHEMSHCLGGFITANSTFSWWGAFFANRRATEVGHKMDAFYPKNWGRDFDPVDLMPPWAIMK